MENIADILRDAPEGIKLYSTAFGNCELGSVVKDEIAIYYEDNGLTECYVLDQYGRFRSDGDCVLFPSKYRQVWNGWQAWLFRDELSLGKVVVDTMGGYFIITHNEKDDIKVADSKGNGFVLDSKELDKYRFATQEEQKEFFEYLERNHCNWDNETKTVFKISPEKDCTRMMDKHNDSYIYLPRDKKELEVLLEQLIKERGNEGDFNDIDTSLITDMSWIFSEYSDFNGDISRWNTSNVTNMQGMFYCAKYFNQPIGGWDTSKVTNMGGMFYEATSFNQPIGDWGISNVTDMRYMFWSAKSFNQDISNWKVNKVIYNVNIFKYCPIKEEYKPKMDEEPKNNSKFKDGDIVTIVKQNNGWTDYLIGIVIGPYIYGTDLSKMSIDKALCFEIRYAKEHEKRRFLSEWKEPKELYTDEEAKEFASKVSHEWWQISMGKWNTLTENEKKKYNQYIGFNDFSDHLMNILRSVLLGLKRNGKLVYEEGSLFSEPDQKPVEIELDTTPVNPTPCYEPKGPYCNGNCGVCVYHTVAGCGRTIEIEYDKSGCESGVSTGEYYSACESGVSTGEYYSAYATKNNKYIPKLKVGDKACLSDKDDNIYFEEILKANDEEYYTKTFGWINCKVIDELHEINLKEYNKPFRVSDFKQFDKVLWRLGPADTWSIGFFDNYYISGEDDKVSYSVVGYEKDWVPQCVPYNIDTEYLHDTDEEYEGKYKTW